MVERIAPLWTEQIKGVLSNYPPTASLFRGVFPCDRMPPPHPLDPETGHFRPWSMVVNTHPSTGPGEHWLLWGADDPYTLHVFDSYGMDVMSFYPNRWFQRYARRFQTLHQNRQPYQGYNTNVCGHYCIYVTAQRCDTGRYDFQELPDLVPHRFQQNDLQVAHIASVDLDVTNAIEDTGLGVGQRCQSWFHRTHK